MAKTAAVTRAAHIAQTIRQKSEPNLEQTKVRFPKIIKNKKTKVEVTIYGKSKGGKRKKDGSVTQPYPFYRVCWRVAGQRGMESFGTYSAAKQAAEKLVRDLGSGSQVTALTPGQANDALAAFERLEGLYRSTGRRVSLLAGDRVRRSCPEAQGPHPGAGRGRLPFQRGDRQAHGLGRSGGRVHQGPGAQDQIRKRKAPTTSASYAYIVAMWLRSSPGPSRARPFAT